MKFDGGGGDRQVVTALDSGSVLVADGQGWLANAYRDHGAAVRAAALRVCGPAYADEVAQEVFVRLWREPGRFDPARGSLRTFLVTVARGRAIDVLRSETSRAARERRNDDALGTSRAAMVEAPEVAVARADEAARIFAAVQSLPERERFPLVVAFYGHCTYQQTARVLQQSEGTTKARIRSGLKHLAAALAESSR